MFTLRHQRTEEEYREAIATMVSECDSTSHLLEDLLLLARGDVSPARIELLAANIATIVKQVSQRAASLASAKAQQIQLHVPLDPIVLLGDNKFLPRLLSILIDNAVKYTPEGGAIRIVLERQTSGSVQLRVQDTGIGMPPELLPKIFDRFYRGDSVRNRNSGGFGLGLAIAKWICVVHAAEITVASVPHLGSTFTVLFPESITRVPGDSEESKMELIGG
jgi:two-component system heavy metal sensor histidine kinase CusS